MKRKLILFLILICIISVKCSGNTANLKKSNKYEILEKLRKKNFFININHLSSKKRFFFIKKNILILEKKQVIKKFNINGKIVWQKYLPNKIIFKPYVYTNKILFFLKNNVLFVLDKKNGKNLRIKKLSLNICSIPLYKKGMLIFNTKMNNIYIFDVCEEKIFFLNKNYTFLKNILFFKKIFLVLNKKYILSYFFNNKMLCINRMTGFVVWVKILSRSFFEKNYLFFKNGCDIYIYDKKNITAFVKISTGKLIYFLYNKYQIKKIFFMQNNLIILNKNGIIKNITRKNGTFVWRNDSLYNKNVKTLIVKKELMTIQDELYMYKLFLNNGNIVCLKKNKKL